MNNGLSQVDQLLELITTSASRAKEEYASAHPLLALDTFEESPVSHCNSQRYQDALCVLRSACAQLTTLLSPPTQTLSLVSPS